jgi:tRNA-splicing ligase RtcB
VSQRAKARGKHQLGTLGSGNHYCEVQTVDQIYDKAAAEAMGLKMGTVCLMIHSGSRGLGHQVCTDHLMIAEQEMKKYNIVTNDRQLSGLRINSEPGKNYLSAMGAAANFAFSNRSLMAYNARQAFEKVFQKSARDLGMNMVYDVCHNMAKIEDHVLDDGSKRKLLVHRKGATRAFPPGHPTLPEKYKKIGQPVIVGGSMGTCSYILVGTEQAMKETWGSACHGAGRNLSRAQSKREIPAKQVMDDLKKKGVVFRVGTPKLIAEEAPESYKDVTSVVETCHGAGICKKVVRLRPLAVVKG